MSVSLLVRVRDVHGDFLDDRVDIDVVSTRTNRTVGQLRDRSVRAGGVRFDGLDVLEHYKVKVFPRRHRPVGQVVRAAADGDVVEVTCPVHPERVRDVEFPGFEDLGARLQEVLARSEVEGHEGDRGQALYLSLSDLQRAGLLNVFTKMEGTGLPDGRTVADYVSDLYRVRGDRVFGNVARALRDQVKDAAHEDRFEEVPGALHEPPPGFDLVDSYKSRDDFGNLQLTFFANDRLDFRVDADIDDANGIRHLFQVLRNWITGQPTHPYDIHQILIDAQALRPGYELVV